MNAQEIRNQIAALKNRSTKIRITPESGFGVALISSVIESHVCSLAEILENVSPEFLDESLNDLSTQLVDTEKTLAWHENKWGKEIDSTPSPIVAFLRSFNWTH